MSTADRQELLSVCEKALAAVGYELVDLELMTEPSGLVLRVFIDHPFTSDAMGKGNLEPADSRQRITHGDCQKASHQLGTELEVEDPIKGAYRLELSSPGLKRRLRKVEDFRRFSGFDVAVKLEQPLSGRKSFSGRLTGVEGDSVVVECDGEAYALPITDIRKAQLNEEY